MEVHHHCLFGVDGDGVVMAVMNALHRRVVKGCVVEGDAHCSVIDALPAVSGVH